MRSTKQQTTEVMKDYTQIARRISAAAERSAAAFRDASKQLAEGLSKTQERNAAAFRSDLADAPGHCCREGGQLWINEHGTAKNLEVK